MSRASSWRDRKCKGAACATPRASTRLIGPKASATPSDAMSAPLYQLPGFAPAPARVLQPHGADGVAGTVQIPPPAAPAPSTVAEVLEQSQAEAVLNELEEELVGLRPVKARIKDIAALLVIDKLRAARGLAAQSP